MSSIAGQNVKQRPDTTRMCDAGLRHPCVSLDARLATSAVRLAANEHLLAARNFHPGSEEAVGFAGVRRRTNSGNRRNSDRLSEGSRSRRGEKRDRSRNQDFGASHDGLHV